MKPSMVTVLPVPAMPAWLSLPSTTANGRTPFLVPRLLTAAAASFSLSLARSVRLARACFTKSSTEGRSSCSGIRIGSKGRIRAPASTGSAVPLRLSRFFN